MPDNPAVSFPSALRALRIAPVLALAVLVATIPGPAASAARVAGSQTVGLRAEPDNDNASLLPSASLEQQAERTENLGPYVNDGSAALVIPASLRERRALLAERARQRQRGNLANVARLNSVLASEAFERAARLTAYWLDHRDGPTGLFPHTLRPDGRRWTYGDVGSDLFPFLAIATHYLLPRRDIEILTTMAAERRLTPGFPRDVSLDTLQPLEVEPEKAMLGVVEYAKDGLVPLVEALGPTPWLGRLREVTDAALATSTVPTLRGPIPSHAAEVNGSALQALARLSWLTDDPRYLEMGRRIAAAYLDDALVTTEHIPPHRWDFIENEPIGPRRFYLGDHGNEIVAGLVEWHRVETHLNLPEGAAHRVAVRKLLDRLLARGRTPKGLWYQIVDVPSGKVRDRDLSDNWGYLGQAYLHQAEIERATPDGDLDAAARYEAAARTMLTSVASVDFYQWEDGEMDGYADTLESALYLLRYLDVPEAADWVDEQIGVLYGYQHADGSVTDENIDGNFVRTVLLYGLSATQGTRLEPWNPEISLGAARDGDCLWVHLHSQIDWRGRLVFDSPRHAANFGLPDDYPRLNQWPEWWAAQPGSSYAITRPSGAQLHVDGARLAAGLPIRLGPDAIYRLRVCPE
ncbi:MAG: hypothetical protein IT305_01410 [Chloroflexi bacterium]|nr:hypothetical protein [Chloroflexota bacterium]